MHSKLSYHQIEHVQREEAHQTGGGLPIKLKAAPHIAIVLEKIGTKPRVKGLKNPIEICSSAKGNQSYQPSLSEDYFQNLFSHVIVEPDNQTSSNSAIDIPSEYTFKRTKVEQLHDFDISETELNDHADHQSTSIEKECSIDNQTHVYSTSIGNERRELADQRLNEKKRLEHEYLELRMRNEQSYARLLEIQMETAQITLENARLEKQKLELQIANEIRKHPSNANSNPDEVYLLPIGDYQ
ncbi:unnamed protein product [Cylicostephanus goldi]|uniref:Uncharacterized protein n=1 Tax=Cylicostephanus goldi TaxID=71465 RepID=A0A3P6QLH1_CYLGO|nr:unnamed protein product [Cylicostephanus goldi]